MVTGLLARCETQPEPDCMNTLDGSPAGLTAERGFVFNGALDCHKLRCSEALPGQAALDLPGFFGPAEVIETPSWLVALPVRSAVRTTTSTVGEGAVARSDVTWTNAGAARF